MAKSIWRGRGDDRIKVWRIATQIIRNLAIHSDANSLGAPVRDGKEHCGWRGDHRDVAIVADYLGGMGMEEIAARANAAEAWIDGEIAALRVPTTIGAINYLKRMF